MGIGFNPNQGIRRKKLSKAEQEGKVKETSLCINSGEDLDQLNKTLDELEQDMKDAF